MKRDHITILLDAINVIIIMLLAFLLAYILTYDVLCDTDIRNCFDLIPTRNNIA